MRYLSELTPEQVKKLYYLREGLKNNGQKTTMAGLVRDATDKHLEGFKKDIRVGKELTEQKERESQRLKDEYARKKIEISKKRMNPEKLALCNKLTDSLN